MHVSVQYESFSLTFFGPALAFVHSNRKGILSEWAFVIKVRKRSMHVSEQYESCSLTFFGPVRASVHSGAVSLILSLGSSHETPKYMDIDMV